MPCIWIASLALVSFKCCRDKEKPQDRLTQKAYFLVTKRVDAAQIPVVAKVDITSFFDNLDTFRTRNQQLSANFCLLQCGNREQHHEHRLSKTSQQRPLFVNTGTPNEP
ncbi:hypothetical protein B4946_14575 [Vibrio cholerae]|nr:hypothetical protein [Vibrio cholerae]